MFKHHDSFHGHTPEFPPYGPHHHDPYGCMEPCATYNFRPVQADWEECDPHKLSFINNKPEVVLSINGVCPDMQGNIDINASVLKAGTLTNAEIYNIVSKVYDL